jgi:hypothetical protein
MVDINDTDNDLLPDYWEPNSNQDRYDDQDKDGANNLEEFLAGTSPTDANDPNGNDTDGDGLWDNWERHFFGDISFYDDGNDPDDDGLTNSEELALGLHPVRAGADKDRDGLPDLWEIRWFGSLAQDANSNFDSDCFDNIEEYELGLDPTSRMADLDRNCNINLVDFSLFALHWRRSDCNEPNWCDGADLDKSGDINGMDLYLLTENWLRRLY